MRDAPRVIGESEHEDAIVKYDASQFDWSAGTTSFRKTSSCPSGSKHAKRTVTVPAPASA